MTINSRGCNLRITLMGIWQLQIFREKLEKEKFKATLKGAQKNIFQFYIYFYQHRNRGER